MTSSEDSKMCRCQWDSGFLLVCCTLFYIMMKGLNPNNLFIPSPAPGVARKQIMELYNSNFYKVLIRLTESPHPKVQYNCAGVIGHLAINGKQLHTLLHCHGNCYSVLSALIYVKPTLSVFNGIIILSNLYVWK